MNQHTNRQPQAQAQAQRRQIWLSILKNAVGRLSKAFWENPDGSVGIDPTTTLWAGSFEAFSVDADDLPQALAEIGKRIDVLGSDQAITLGVPKDGTLTGRITTVDRHKTDPEEGTIPRALSHFGAPPQDDYALILFDGDGTDQLHAKLTAHYPGFADVATASRPSASASVKNPKTGKPLKVAEHCFAVIDQPALAADVLDAFLRLAWVNGQGWIMLTEDGRMLPRGIVDTAVGTLERLVYEGEVVVGKGIERLPRVTTVGSGTKMLCASAVLAYADRLAPQEKYLALVETEKARDPARIEESQKRKAAYREMRVVKEMAQGKTRGEAEDAVDRADGNSFVKDGRIHVELLASHVLHLTDGTTCTIADIAKDPKAYHERACADPIEGLAYPSKSCAKIYARHPNIRIPSFAHGSSYSYFAPLPWPDCSTTIGPKILKLVADQNSKPPMDDKPSMFGQPRANAAAEPNWRELLKGGHPRASFENARVAIVIIGVICSYDTFHNKLLIEFDGSRAEVSDHVIMMLRQRVSHTFGFDLTEKHLRDAITVLALEHCFDPVADMLAEAEAKWDKKPRLDRMSADYFNCEDTPLNAACLRKTMIAAVARVREPGCKFDTIPVLEADEGWNKSTAWRVLAGDENYSDESIIGKNSREVQEQLAGVWIHENAELAGMKKAEVEMVKAYASRQVDRARPAYGHFRVDQPRHSIETGTTNSDRYLQSQTGNRRFWPKKMLKPVDIEKLKRDRLQLWGEAAHYQSEGEALTLDESMWPAAGIEQEARRIKDPWEDTLADLSKRMVSTGKLDAQGSLILTPLVERDLDQERIATTTIMGQVLGLPEERREKRHEMKLGEVMRVLGWQRAKNGRVTINGKQVSGYFRDVKKPEPQ